MVGRKALVLTIPDVQQVIKHIKQLPFKRKVQERFMEMLQDKRTMNDFSESDLELVKKCRYEMNAHIKQMRALEEIKAKFSHTRFEKEILESSNKSDIDSYFFMLESLKIYLKKIDQKQAETAIQNKKKKMESKQDDLKPKERTKRNRELYYLGVAVKTMLDKTGVFLESGNDLNRLIDVIGSARLMREFIRNEKDLKRRISELNQSEEEKELKKTFDQMLEDPRNPFKIKL